MSASPKFLNVLTEGFLASQYVSDRRSLSAIAKEVDTSTTIVAAYLRRHGFAVQSLQESNRRYSALQNIDGFRGPTTDWHAYWLGFISADGCVYRKYPGSGAARNLLRIRLKSNDKPHLENFRAGLKTNSPVKETVGKDGSPYAQIEVNSEQLINVLAVWGIVQNKSLTLPFPNMSAKYLPGFIRGYFDGDGTIYWRLRAQYSGKNPQPVCRFISGSLEFLRGLETALSSFGVATLSLYRNGKSNAYHLPLSNAKRNLRKFASLLYDDATVALERKHTAFLPLLRDN